MASQTFNKKALQPAGQTGLEDSGTRPSINQGNTA